MPAQKNRFTQLRVLLPLTDRGSLAQSTSGVVAGRSCPSLPWDDLWRLVDRSQTDRFLLDPRGVVKSPCPCSRIYNICNLNLLRLAAQVQALLQTELPVGCSN
jgi:pimeloyl-ACP methyl ester carboxylesterase